MFGFDVGAALAGVGNYFGAREQRHASADQQRELLAWQERMSNSAYQRAVKDLRRAGLNPMLAYMTGAASTPSAQQYPVENMMEGVGQGVISTAMDARRLKQEIRESLSRMATNAATQSKVDDERDLLKAQASLNRANARIARSEAISSENRADIEVKYPKVFGILDAIIKRAGLNFGPTRLGGSK